MTGSTNIHAYAHVKDILEQVLEKGCKAEYDCGTARAAIRFRQEVHSYRRLLEKENYALYMRYSHLRLVIQTKKRPNVVVFEDRTVWGKLEFFPDQPFEYVPPPTRNIEQTVENLDDLLPENT